ncbi:MAG: SUMF1/EgtB/PvdO family nonheme iron enzyme [Candidatus Hydrogenedentota bacterium]
MDDFEYEGDEPTLFRVVPELVLAGRFRLVQRVGRGGMGEVWLAQDTELEEYVALKVLKPELLGNNRAVDSFKREVRLTRKLRHPNIVGVHDFHTHGGLHFISMEYVDGASLADRLAQRGEPFTLDEVLPWAQQVAAALGYAHSKEVLHRDVKPGNMLVAQDGTLKLADFGIARIAKDTQTRLTGHATSGTLAYMSPQQLMNEKAHRNDPRNDVYAFAVTLYELLSGDPPFTGGDISMQIMMKQPEPLEDVPPHVNGALLHGLAKEVVERPPNCAALVKLLEQAAARPREGERPREGARTREPETLPTTQHTAQREGERPREPETPPTTQHTAQREGERPREPATAPSEKKSNCISDQDIGLMDTTDPAVSPCEVFPDIAAARQRTTAPNGEITRTVDLGGGVMLDLVWIPPGEFLMGSPESEERRSDPEGPQHPVEITRGFWMGKYPVTQAQWEAVMGNNPSHFSEKRLGTRVSRFFGAPEKEYSSWPVESISWNDCREFLKALNKRFTHDESRLPTEAEWEYACRAGSTTAYCFGDSESDLGAYAWYDDNSGGETHPVGRKRANAWGLHDMHGNVWEWCEDDSHSNYTGAPADGSAWVDSPRGSSRVLRGGSWFFDPGYCRSADRDGSAPGNGNCNLGFRLALSPVR